MNHRSQPITIRRLFTPGRNLKILETGTRIESSARDRWPPTPSVGTVLHHSSAKKARGGAAWVMSDLDRSDGAARHPSGVLGANRDLGTGWLSLSLLGLAQSEMEQKIEVILQVLGGCVWKTERFCT